MNCGSAAVLAEYISRLKPVRLLRSVGRTINRTPAQVDYDNRSSSSNAHLEKPPHERSMPIFVLLATLAVALLYIGLLSWYLPIDGFWSGDQGAKLVQVQTLLR